MAMRVRRRRRRRGRAAAAAPCAAGRERAGGPRHACRPVPPRRPFNPRARSSRPPAPAWTWPRSRRRSRGCCCWRAACGTTWRRCGSSWRWAAAAGPRGAGRGAGGGALRAVLSRIAGLTPAPPRPAPPPVVGARAGVRHRPRVARAPGPAAGVPPRGGRHQRGLPRGRRPRARAVRGAAATRPPPARPPARPPPAARRPPPAARRPAARRPPPAARAAATAATATAAGARAPRPRSARARIACREPFLARAPRRRARPRAPRWAAKQRAERARGTLGGDKAEALEALGFQWDEDEAEWLRWFIDLARWGGGAGGGGRGAPACTPAKWLWWRVPA